MFITIIMMVVIILIMLMMMILLTKVAMLMMMILLTKVAMIEERRTHLLNQLHFRASTKREKLGASSSSLSSLSSF